MAISFKLNVLTETQKRIDAFTDGMKEAIQWRYSDIERYKKHLNDMYAAETARRMKLCRKVKEKNLIKDVVQFCSIREQLVDFMVDWCWTYDPRNVNLGLPSTIPWIPWQQQIDFIEWFYNRYLNMEGGLVDKCREVGATWLFCLCFWREWRWENGFAAGIGSRKAELVDKKADPKSVFEKIRFIQYNLPIWFYPLGYNKKIHDKVNNIYNPQMQSSITGEAGEQIGRGGRTGVYLVDEKAFLEQPEEANKSLSNNTNCQFDLSTPNGMNEFGQKRHSGRVGVFSFDWRDDPRKNQEWYDKFKKEYGETITAQEVDCDYTQSVAGLFIEQKWVDAAKHIKLSKRGIKSGGLDISEGSGGDDTILATREGSNVYVEKLNIDNGVDLTHQVIDICNLKRLSYLNYDRIGTGYTFKSNVERTEYPMFFKNYAIDSRNTASGRQYPEFGNKKGYELFINVRAENWYNLARRFEKTYEHVANIRKWPESEMISICDDDELAMQLCSVKKIHTNKGKIKAESKDEMIKRGVSSPDKADAVMMAFIDSNAGMPTVLKDFDTVFISQKDIIHNNSLFIGCTMRYVDNMHASLLFWQYSNISGRVFCFDEHIINNEPIKVKMISDIINSNIKNIPSAYFYANDVIFPKNDKEPMHTIWDELIDEGICFEKVTHDSYISHKVQRFNKWIEQQRIIINTKCNWLKEQSEDWIYDNNNDPARSGYDLSLCLADTIDRLEEESERFLKAPTVAFFEKMERLSGYVPVGKQATNSKRGIFYE